MRLWIPRQPSLRAAAIEQLLLQHDVDIWRLRKRLAGGIGDGAAGDPDWIVGSSSSSSSSSSSDCVLVSSCTTSFQYTFTVSGVASGGSPDCANVNRTWTLSFIGSGTWREAPGGLGWTSELFYNVGTLANRLRFTDAGGIRAIYEVACFDCGGSNIFSFVSSTRCSGWPATITVSKV